MIKGCKEAYANAEYWKKFTIIEDAVDPSAIPQCATPTIDIINDKVIFNSETEGAEIKYEYVYLGAGDNRIGFDSGFEFSLHPTDYTLSITAYATAEGYTDSETVTKTINLAQSKINHDINGDGKITMEDVNNLLNIYLKQ